MKLKNLTVRDMEETVYDISILQNSSVAEYYFISCKIMVLFDIIIDTS